MYINLIVVIVAIGLTSATELILNEESIQSNWEAVQKYLGEQSVLRLYQEGITQESMNRILSLELPRLQELHFELEPFRDARLYRHETHSAQILTHRLVKTIFTSRYFPRLTTLNLFKTNIDDRYLSFLEDTDLSTSLRNLNLGENLIGKRGFQYLSKIKFDNLTNLQLGGTLLKEEDAVDALITIICGKEPDQCNNNLEKLGLQATNIDRQHFIKLMNRINPDSLLSLQLTNLNLIYEKTYKEGFNYSAFELLSSKFFNLEKLDLAQCEINDQVAEIFKNWKLPNLISLGISSNHLTDKGVVAWITRQNMPNLEEFNIGQNEVGDETIDHLAAENFQFTILGIGNSKFTAAGIGRVGSLNTQRLQKLILVFDMPTKVLNNLIQSDSFPALRHLSLGDNDLLTFAWTKISWGKLKKLQFLQFVNINLKESFWQLFSTKEDALIPNLKQLVLQNIDADYEIANNLLVMAPYYFPKLEILILREMDSLKISPKMLETATYNEGAFIDINMMQMYKRGLIYELINLPMPEFIFFSRNEEELQVGELLSRIPTIARRYDFTLLQELTFTKDYLVYLFFKVLKEDNIKELPNLRRLFLTTTLDVEFLMSELAGFNFPSLRRLFLSLVIPADTQYEQIERTLIPFLQKFTLLNYLYLDVTFLNEETGFLQKKWLLDSLYYPQLSSAQMPNQNMEVDELAEFVRVHNQTLRVLNLANNFMEKDFLKILVEAEYVLGVLNLDSTSFAVDEFAILGKMRTQFLYALYLSENDLKNEHILAMLQQKKPGPYFPNLEFLKLQGNDIRKQGLEALLQAELFWLIELDISLNSNPQFINLLLTYPTRIRTIQAANVQVYGMQDDLEPTSARNINKLIIQSKSFIKEDFDNLARLSFSKLEDVQITLHNIYDCSVLADILKISQNGIGLNLQFRNVQNGLNSSCLKNTTFESGLSYLSIDDQYGTTYLPQFVLNVMNTHLELKFLNFHETRLPPDVFKRIFSKAAFSQLQVLAIHSNYMGDEGLRPLLNSDLNNLRYLELTNSEITDSSIEGLSMARLKYLNFLILDQNRLGKKAMESLRKIKSEQLIIISLERCELTGPSLDVISLFKFKYLADIELGYNNFQEADVVEFVANLERTRLPSLQHIGLKGISLSKEGYTSVVDILTTKSIQFSLDAPHNIVKVNSAEY